ncbi:MAG: MBL fold metallo-hydrolase [Candidatus Heimdallarchaeota archaeon]
MTVAFRVIASGSNGNAAYISSGENVLVIDAGISKKRLMSALLQEKLTLNNVQGTLVSHAHTDHCSGLPVISENTHSPIYCSRGTMRLFHKLEKIAPRWINIAGRCRLLPFDKPTSIGEFKIIPLKTVHDVIGSIGFQISVDDINLTLITDTGKITHEHIRAMRESQIVLLETNHDLSMLWDSGRPAWLKKRIRANHLANNETNSTLQSLIDSEIEGMFLGHLSGECNSPELVAHHITSMDLPVNWDWFICRRTKTGTRVECDGENLSYKGQSEDLKSLAGQLNRRPRLRTLLEHFPEKNDLF